MCCSPYRDEQFFLFFPGIDAAELEKAAADLLTKEDDLLDEMCIFIDDVYNDEEDDDE